MHFVRIDIDGYFVHDIGNQHMKFFIPHLLSMKNDPVHFEIDLHLLQMIRKQSRVVNAVAFTF